MEIARALEPALQMSLTWYSCGAYPTLSSLSRQELQTIADPIVDFTCETPVVRDSKGEFPSREIPWFGRISIVHAVAVGGAILVWQQLANRVETKEELADKSEILRACVEGYSMWELFEGGCLPDASSNQIAVLDPGSLQFRFGGL